METKTLHRIININGMKAPRLKSWKDRDQEDYGKPRNFSVQKILFKMLTEKA